MYAEEMTDRVEIVSKNIDGEIYTGVRFYLKLPAFMHHPGDDDSSAVTFWGKRGLEDVLKKALRLLSERKTNHE